MSEQSALIEGGWVGTWAVAPQGDNSTSQDKTIRHTVRTSIGGSGARIRISNVFGSGRSCSTAPSSPERVNGSSIPPASNRALEFGG